MILAYGSSDSSRVQKGVYSCHVASGVFFLGSFSKDSIVNLTTGWAEDMRTPTFVQNFVVTYYVLNCWASADFKLKAK